MSHCNSNVCNEKNKIDELKKELHGLLLITGSESKEQQEANKHKFQNDDRAMNILVSLKCSEGHTLTASSSPLLVELPWTFAACEQCEDRAHRIGAKENVTARYLLGHNTIDQKIYKLILEKKDIAKTITGSQEEVEENVISQLIDLFNQEI